MNFRTGPLSLARFYLKAHPWRNARTHRDRLRKKDKDALVVMSFPKAGRTWHRVLLGYYLAVKSGVPETDALKLHGLCDRLALPRIGYSHGGAAFSDGLPSAHPSVADPELLRGKRVLFLIRDPRDILVSAFFHARDRKEVWSLGLSEFIRNDRTGINKVLSAYSRWFGSAQLAEAFDVIAYEDMHADAGEALRRTLRFAGARQIDESVVARAVEFTRFENMRQMEERDYFDDKVLRATGSSAESRKVRSGRVGGFSDYLSDEDLELIANEIRKTGGPMADRYLNPPPGRSPQPGIAEAVPVT